MEEKMTDNGKKSRKAEIIIFVVLFVIAGLFYLMYRTMIPVDYHRFNAERIAEVEDLYKISLDDAVPERFKQILLGHEYQLVLYTDDYEKLMDSFTGDGMNLKREAPDKSNVEYRGIDNHHEIMVSFKKVDDKKGKYRGLFRYLLDNDAMYHIDTNSESTVS